MRWLSRETPTSKDLMAPASWQGFAGRGDENVAKRRLTKVMPQLAECTKGINERSLACKRFLYSKSDMIISMKQKQWGCPLLWQAAEWFRRFRGRDSGGSTTRVPIGQSSLAVFSIKTYYIYFIARMFHWLNINKTWRTTSSIQTHALLSITRKK